jgi:methionyl-tRNA formyltransferase
MNRGAADNGPVTRLVLVTGHTFGLRAFEGIFSAPAYLDGRLSVELMVGLDTGKAAGTVGFLSTAGLAAEQGLPHVLTTDGRLSSIAGTIRECRPHYLLVIGWTRLVADDVLAIPAESADPDEATGPTGSRPGERAGSAFGCIGMHPTKLPAGRGQAPIPWTIIKGLRSTALSVFFLEAAADTGAVIAQYDLAVHPRETAASLFYRVAAQHFAAGRDLAAGLADRSVTAMRQDDQLATVWPKRRPADGEISASMSCAEIDALVRALLGPYPRAFVTVDGRQYPVRAVEPVGRHAARPGASADPAAGLTQVDVDSVYLRCRDGAVRLLRADGKSSS